MNRFLSVLLGLLLTLSLYGAYFFNLVRNELQVMLGRQQALEGLKLLAVPGTEFLNGLGPLFVLKSALFYLVLMGMLPVLAQLFSLCLRRPWHRLIFLALLLVGLVLLTHGDRIALSFPLVTVLAFGAFFFITLNVRVRASWGDLAVLLVLGGVLSSSLWLAAGENFFIKTRDRLLFDSRIGSRVVDYYYTYSPLAAAVVTPAMGVYEGLVYQEGFASPFRHLGRGLVLSGNPSVKARADYVLEPRNGGYEMVSRYGDRRALPDMDEERIREAASSLFSMEGFKVLNRISLYAFPAGLLMLPFFFLRMATERRKPFLLMSLSIGILLVAFIGAVSFVGTSPPGDLDPRAPLELDPALGLAYELYEERDVPPERIPAVRRLAQADSIALRYWGAKLLAYAPKGGPEFNQALAGLLQDPSPNVRYAAGLSLYRRMGAGSFRHLLPRLITDPNWYVRCILFSAFLRSGTIPHRM
jgi:hypothetical protein